MAKVYIATDHAGFDLKNHLIPFIGSLGHEVVDMGALEYNQDDDYPDFILPCAQNVASDMGSFGIVLGHSGQGEAMVANRVPGIRAGVYYGGSLEIVALLRDHNNANILSLGAHFLSPEEAQIAVETFLSALFSEEERHERRINKF